MTIIILFESIFLLLSSKALVSSGIGMADIKKSYFSVEKFQTFLYSRIRFSNSETFILM